LKKGLRNFLAGIKRKVEKGLICHKKGLWKDFGGVWQESYLISLACVSLAKCNVRTNLAVNWRETTCIEGIIGEQFGSYCGAGRIKVGSNRGLD
jgi:hypothetical protein